MDMQMTNKSRNQTVTLADFITSPAQKPNDTVIQNDLLKKLLLDSNDDISTFIGIVTDINTPEAFESWLDLNYDVRLDDVKDDRKITNYALEYLKLEKAPTRQHIKARYEKYLRG
jgi:hypothetical protein